MKPEEGEKRWALEKIITTPAGAALEKPTRGLKSAAIFSALQATRLNIPALKRGA
jgi:hypothetical protein